MKMLYHQNFNKFVDILVQVIFCGPNKSNQIVHTLVQV